MMLGMDMSEEAAFPVDYYDAPTVNNGASERQPDSSSHRSHEHSTSPTNSITAYQRISRKTSLPI